MTSKEAIHAAASNIGGVRKLADALGLKRASVYAWRQVPPHHVLAVERLTGVSRQELRPDLYPEEV